MFRNWPIIVVLNLVYVYFNRFLIRISVPIHTWEDLDPVPILKEHFRQYFDLADLEQSVNSFHVCQNHMWHDALRAISKPVFDPFLPVRVTFIGEPAVDDGEPCREFFSLALMKMSEDTTIFQGPPECRSFVHNMQGLQKRTFFLVGLFVGLSLANGGPGLACLAKTIYNYLYVMAYRREQTFMRRR